jgi:hypothetical protein
MLRKLIGECWHTGFPYQTKQSLWIQVPSLDVIGLWFGGLSTFSESIWIYRNIYINQLLVDFILHLLGDVLHPCGHLETSHGRQAPPGFDEDGPLRKQARQLLGTRSCQAKGVILDENLRNLPVCLMAWVPIYICSCRCLKIMIKIKWNGSQIEVVPSQCKGHREHKESLTCAFL